ncbi:MAG: hypothetical protein D3918_06875 [Candidatus Electrothrix sp. AX2]|nr:hypothetical protein [Candidatus Electrothrix gigas]
MSGTFKPVFDLLQQLAYEPELFERCADLLCRVALFEWQHETDNRRQYSEKLRSLFYLWFSGTHAPVEERLKIIEKLVSSHEQYRQELGFYFLEAALEAGQFGAFHDFTFGTRSRNYGYQPRSHEDYSHWFGSVVDLCLQLILDDPKLAGRTRRLFASKLDGIWNDAQTFTVVEKAAQQIHAQKGWHEGWLTVKGIIRDDRKDADSATLERLSVLEKFLRPVGLLERARTYAFSGIWQGYDLEDEFEGEDFVDQYSKVKKITRTIACQVAQTPEVLNIMLPELVSAHTDTYHGRLDAFGKGLADGVTDKAKLFQSLRSEYIKTSPEQRSRYVFTGFLASCSENDPPVCNMLLDGLVEDEVLGEWFPQLQTSCMIDRRAVERLHQSLDFGKAPVAAFRTLGMRYVYKCLSDDELAGLLRKILQREGGAKEVLITFSMKHSEKRRKDKGWKEKSTCLQEVMRDCLCHYQFYTNKKDRHSGNDYQLAQLAAACLNGTEGADAAQNVCQRFVESVTTANYYIRSYPRFLQSLARMQPDIFLDEFLGKPSLEEEGIPNRLKYFFSRHFRHYKNPLDEIRDDVILAWYEIAYCVVGRWDVLG